MTRDEARDYIKQAVPITDFVGEMNHSGMCVCPFCQSGTGEGPNSVKHSKTPAFKVYLQENTYCCYSCGDSGDVIHLYEQLNNVGYNDALYDLASIAGIAIDRYNNYERKTAKKPIERPQIPKRESKPEAHKDYSAYMKFARDHVNETDYFQKRGFSKGFVEYCGLGFVPKCTFKDLENGGIDRDAPAIIIPYTRNKVSYYWARATDGSRMFKKPARSIAGPEPIFNAPALKGDKAVFVCESPLDALSIIQLGGTAVSIGGSTAIDKLIDAVKDHKPERPLILALDEDGPGKDGIEKLKKSLDKINMPYITAEWSLDKYPQDKELDDPNSLLMASARQFSDDVVMNERYAEKAYQISNEIKEDERNVKPKEQIHTKEQTKIVKPKLAEAVL